MGKGWGIVCAAMVLGLLAGCSRSEIMLPEAAEKSQSEPAQITSTEFPCVLSDGLLIAEKLVCYSGLYWEDGSGEYTENVAGLMISNPTEKMLEFGAFSVEQEEKKLYFFAYQVPPKSRCLILEYEKKPWDFEQVTACRVISTRWAHQELSREQIDYLGLGPMLTVINRDTRQLSRVTVWYKQYDKAQKCYLGGAVQSTLLPFLQPEERRTVLPEHYTAASARIVEIKWEI